MTRRHLILHGALLLSLACSTRSADERVWSGTIEAVEVDVVPEVSGRILTRPVDQGDQVKTGDLVATIDPEPYRLALAETQAALRAARARSDLLRHGYRREEIAASAREVDEAAALLRQAESRVERVDRLVAEGVATPDDRDVARRDLEVSQARLAASKERLGLLTRGFRREEIDQARAEADRLEALLAQRQLDLERTRLVSPATGTVTEKLMEPGEYARAGSPIVTVTDLVNLYTWVYLSSVEVAQVKVGDRVSVRIDGAPGRDFAGEVVYISQEAEFTPRNVQTREDRVQLVYGVKVAVANTEGILKIGIPADVVLGGPGPS